MDNRNDTARLPPVSTWEVLRALGFVEDETVCSEPRPGLRLVIGPMDLTASRVLGRCFAPVVFLGGVYSSDRRLGEISHELPLTVESFDHGVALLTWIFDQAAGSRFGAKSASTSGETWLEVGRRLSHLLPWMQLRDPWAEERAAYAARPLCLVRRDWARVALKSLAEQLSAVDDNAEAAFGFDGSVLTIRCSGRVIAMPAEGQAWTQPYPIKAGTLRSLPKRLMRDPVEVSIWSSALVVGRWRCRGATSTSPDGCCEIPRLLLEDSDP